MRLDELQMFELIDEIDEACKKVGATYFLIGDELLYYTIGNRVHSCLADICMTLGDYNKIKEIIESGDDRVIECIDNNQNIPGLYYRYVNTSTLLVQPEYHKVRNEHGIAVNIHILRNVSEESDELCEYEDILESGIEGIQRKISRKKKKKFSEMLKNGRHVDFLKNLFESAALEDKSHESLLKMPGIGVLRFPEKYWDDDHITINKKKYHTISSPDQYLIQSYGESYAEKIYRPCTEFFRMIVYSDISYRDMDDVFWEKLEFDDEFWRKREPVKDFYFDEWLKLNQGLRIRQDEFYCQRSRFFLWKKYHYNKRKLQTMLREKRYDELLLAFRELDIYLFNHLKYKNVPIFDKEIIDIYLEILEVNGESEKADTLRNAIENCPIEDIDSGSVESFYSEIPEESMEIRKCFDYQSNSE